MTKKGFSLIELIVAVTIIALLSAGAVVSLSNVRVRSREARRISDISQISDALESYVALGNAYPSADTTSVSVNSGLLQPLVNVGVIKTIPDEPYPMSGAYSDTIPCAHYLYRTKGNPAGTFNGQPVGVREYLVGFGSEIVGTNSIDQVHPLNSSIYDYATKNQCGGARGFAAILGARTN